MSYLIVVLLMFCPTTKEVTPFTVMEVKPMPNAEMCTAKAAEMNERFAQTTLKDANGNVVGFYAECQTEL